MFIMLFWILTASALVWSLVRDKKRTLSALGMARGMMRNMVGEIIGILMAIGLLLTLIPTSAIQEVLGGNQVSLATILSAVVGGITLIPAFVAFSLAGSLVDAGASLVPITAFLTTLTMVGFVTFPLEKKAFGLRFSLYRNGLSFVMALLIALGMGVLL